MAEVCDGGGDDGVVEEGLVAGVGEDEGGVEELAGEAWEAAAGAEDELGGGLGEEAAGGAGGAQGVVASLKGSCRSSTPSFHASSVRFPRIPKALLI